MPAETARLIASLELEDKFTKTADRGIRKIDQIDRKLGAFSGAVNRNLGRAVDATIARGVRFLTGSITTGLEELATLEDATTSVDGAIAQLGLTGKVTSGQIAVMANEIERDVQAAFDDKAIVSATETLLRFGKLAPENLEPAMVVMTDLAAKTGDVDSAASLLAKALADPTKAAGKLARAGVILTKQQQKQIAAMVKAGDTAGAQRVLLDALADTTGGAAASSAGKYRDTLNLLADAGEDARKALAEGFFPVIQRVSGKITELASDPKVLAQLRSFGENLAGAFDHAVDVAEDIDWKAVGDGLESAAGWASRLFSAFQSLPTETRGMIIALGGLSKLTGGAPIKIAVDFAKDAITGAFGHFFDRGASPANPMWVAQVGGKGTGDPTGGAPGGKGTGGKGAPGEPGGPPIVKIGTLATAIAFAVQGDTPKGSSGGAISDSEFLASLKRMEAAGRGKEMVSATENVEQAIRRLESQGVTTNNLLGTITGKTTPGANKGGSPMAGWADGRDAWKDYGETPIRALESSAVAAIDGSRDKLLDSQGVLDQSVVSGARQNAAATATAASGVRAATLSGAAAVVGAVRASRDVWNIRTVVNVSASGVTSAQTNVSRQSQSSSKENDERHYGG